MTALGVGNIAGEIPFSDADFRAIADLAQREFGLSLAESKKPLVYSRLSKRLRARQMTDFETYIHLLAKDEESYERLELISALTTNVTSFFRERHHFDTLGTDCMPALLRKTEQGQRVRIWSAGCSSGQEPYSIAMTLLDAIPEAERLNIKVLATDIDPQSVRRAQAGVYPVEEQESIPPAFRDRWTWPCEGGKMEVAPAVRGLITFAELNLINEWPFRGPFDAIFCRNVAIYFNQATQQRLWTRLADMLVDGGHLFIGHSERVTGLASERLSGVGITTYRRIRP